MEYITYDDFAKLDIRLGTIREVHTIDGADKLLRCMVDVGDGVTEDGQPILRQILSGIREYITDPQSLVGRQFPYVVNLAPRTIRGFESHGMILAAKEDATLALLAPTTPLTPGTHVS